MKMRVGDSGYRALAEFRYQIRYFLTDSDEAARSAGLEPEQYQLLLAIKGMPVGQEPAIQALAHRLRVHHNTAVERIDRLARMGLLQRKRGHSDARVVLVELTARGERLLGSLAGKRMTELCQAGPKLIAALARVISATRHLPTKKAGARGGNSRSRKKKR